MSTHFKNAYAASLAAISLIILTSAPLPSAAGDLAQSNTDAEGQFVISKIQTPAAQRSNTVPGQQSNSPATQQLPESEFTDYSVIFLQTGDDQTTQAQSSRAAAEPR